MKHLTPCFLFLLWIPSLRAQSLEGHMDDNGKMGFQKNGAWVIPAQYDDVVEFYGGAYAQVKKGGKWGMIDTLGKVVVPIVYDGFLDTQERYYAAVKGKKFGIVDVTKGRMVADCIYDNELSFNDVQGFGFVATAIQNGRVGLIDTLGRLVLPCQYDFSEVPFEEISPGLFRAVKQRKVGVINREGKVIIPFQFTDIRMSEWVTQKIITTMQGKKFGAWDVQGLMIAPCVYDDEIYFGEDGYGVVVQHRKYGLIDLAGKVVLPLKYDNDDAMTEDRQALQKK